MNEPDLFNDDENATRVDVNPPENEHEPPRDPKEKHDQLASSAARARAAHKKKFGRDKPPQNESAAAAELSDSENDTTKKLRAEKETIIACLRAVVEALDGVDLNRIAKEKREPLEKAYREAAELVRLIDAVPKT